MNLKPGRVNNPCWWLQLFIWK